jgi:hypothetical protein
LEWQPTVRIHGKVVTRFGETTRFWRMHSTAKR